MCEVRCFKHPKYKGKGPPEVSCRACCSIFIVTLKRERDEKSEGDHLEEVKNEVVHK